MKQTAVEWLIEQIKKEHPFWTDIFKQAKEMEKEQSKTDYEMGQASTKFKFPLTADRYYKEYYGSNNE